MFRKTFIAAPILCAFALFGSAPQAAHSAPSITPSQPQTAPLVTEARVRVGGGGGGGGMRMGGGGGRMSMGGRSGGRMFMGGRSGGRMSMGGNRGFVRGFNRGGRDFMRSSRGRMIDRSFSRRGDRSLRATHFGARNIRGARGFDRHHLVNRGRHSRRFIHRHGRHFFFGPGYDFWYYDGYYYGNCGWLRQRALVTGSSYWWRRYQLCYYWN
jgi:hypothetical protein